MCFDATKIPPATTEGPVTNYQDLPKRYRIQDPYLDDGTPVLVTYYVVRKTPSGAWIAPGWLASMLMLEGMDDKQYPVTGKELRQRGARLVADGEGKRYAHETIEWARYSYRKRKLMQIRMSERAMRRAKNGLHWLTTGRSTQDEVLLLREQKGNPLI